MGRGSPFAMMVVAEREAGAQAGGSTGQVAQYTADWLASETAMTAHSCDDSAAFKIALPCSLGSCVFSCPATTETCVR